MTRETEVTFRAGNLRLEGMMALPRGASHAVIVCHPHPQYGGAMDNPVVTAVTCGLAEAGIATLRFNFRGVGASEGTYGGSFAEADDTRAAVEYLRGEADVAAVTLAGYSFGAMVALLAGHDHSRVDRLVAIALPATMFDTGLLTRSDKPALFLLGDRDPYCRWDALERLVQTLPAPKWLVRLDGADHFLAGFEDAIAAHVVRFVTGETKNGGGSA